MLADSNWANVTAARRMGLQTHYGNVLSETAEDEIDLYGIGRLLALTPNDEVNALAALHFGDVFGRASVYQLPLGDKPSGRRREGIPQHLRGRWVFREDATYEHLAARMRAGAVIKRTGISEEFDYDAFMQRYGASAIPLFIVRGPRDVEICTVAKPISPKPGHTLISLVDPKSE